MVPYTYDPVPDSRDIVSDTYEMVPNTREMDPDRRAVGPSHLRPCEQRPRRPTSNPHSFLFVDESGVAGGGTPGDPYSQYLCLLGCVVKSEDYWREVKPKKKDRG